MKMCLSSILSLAACVVGSVSVFAESQPDPQMKAVLDKLATLGGKPAETLDAGEARKQPSPADAVKAIMKEKDIAVPKYTGDVEDTELKLGDGDVKARIYTPKGKGPFPAVLYIHGGGWVIADIETYAASSLALAIDTGAVVVSTDYRRGPEHKFPAAHNDTVGAYEYLLGNAKKLKIDPSKIAVMGESAGGNMAVGICMAAKEKGLAMPVHQVLIYPVSETAAKTSPSMEANMNAKPLNVAMLKWFGKNYLNNEAEAADPRMSPALAGDKLKGLPPATIITAEIDPLLSGAEKLSKALSDNGVVVNYKTYPGVTHEFYGMGTVVDKAKDAETVVATDLKKAFGM